MRHDPWRRLAAARGSGCASAEEEQPELCATTTATTPNQEDKSRYTGRRSCFRFHIRNSYNNNNYNKKTQTNETRFSSKLADFPTNKELLKIYSSQRWRARIWKSQRAAVECGRVRNWWTDLVQLEPNCVLGHQFDLNSLNALCAPLCAITKRAKIKTRYPVSALHYTAVTFDVQKADRGYRQRPRSVVVTNTAGLSFPLNFRQLQNQQKNFFTPF